MKTFDERAAPESVWKKLLRNKAGVSGLLIIIISFLIAIFAYVIAPDRSVNANTIIVELAARKPMHQQQFIVLPSTSPLPIQSIVDQWLFGKKDNEKWIPIQSWKQLNNTIIAEKWVDDGLTETISINLNNKSADDFIKTKTFLLGTDKFGRDMLSRLIIGIRVSLGVGCIAVIISLTVGVFFGAAAGYFGGRIDRIIMWLINVVCSIPTLLLVFAFTLALGKGFWQVFIAVGLTLWVNVARLVRGQVMSIRTLNYIEAATAMGFSDLRIIIRHVLPNIIGPILVIAASNFATAIVLEAGLSFLGIGVQPPQPSWGLMMKENYNFIITNNPALALAPGISIMILVLAFNLLGNGLRDAVDVRGE